MKIDVNKIAKAYGLKNALAHNGKAQQGAIISGLFAEGLKKEDMKKYAKEVSEIVNEINNLSIEQQRNEFEKLKNFIHEREVREGLPELPNAKKGKVIMRMSPSPSGAFHIGHVLTASISYLFVKEYGGKFYVRIEDTNPDNIYKPAYKLLEEDSKWLFEGKAKIIIQSKRMKLYYDYIKKLINKKAAYICTCDSEKFKELINKKQECPCRSLSIKENLERWKKMIDKGKNSFKQGEAVLRFKSPEGVTNKNPAMRDFPLARINVTEHPLQKNKYKVWPLMNLAVAVDDIGLKMTHVIRAKEHRDNAERQLMIYKALGKEKQYPWTSYLGRIHFKDMELSSTKITHGVKEGKYTGWDDPQLPTLAALRKKGYKPQAFWKFAERIGLSENDKIMDKKEFFDLLDDFNKKAVKEDK